MSEQIKNEVCEFCGGSHTSMKHLRMADDVLKFNNGNREEVLKAEQRGPRSMELIRINGRWGQVLASQDLGQEQGDVLIKWLDDGSNTNLDLKEYSLKIYYNSHVELFQHYFSPDQINHIFLGTDTPAHLKKEASIFGEYVSKNSS